MTDNTTNTTRTPKAPDGRPARSSTTSPWLVVVFLLVVISMLQVGSFLLIHMSVGRFGSGKAKSEENPAAKFSLSAPLDQAKEVVAKAKLVQPKPSELTETPAKKAPASKEEEANAPASMETTGKKNLFNRKKDSVNWPHLSLTGFGKTGSGGFAIVNGKSVLLNGYIEGAQLIEVREHDVVMEYEGKVKYLTILTKE
ncbi:MAG: hypothetical protein K9M45_03625 [Kiritimatiellales bacterium]|nr:hypothetical protein [Kiritimatiellales bacterium]